MRLGRAHGQQQTGLRRPTAFGEWRRPPKAVTEMVHEWLARLVLNRLFDGNRVVIGDPFNDESSRMAAFTGGELEIPTRC